MPSASQRADPRGLESLEAGLLRDAPAAGRAWGGSVRLLRHDRVTVPCVLRLHDTATGEVATLGCASPGRVGLYVCGPTVDGVPHLGHGRFSLVFDVLRRYLIFSGLDVTYVSNITDIEDKIIDRAAAQGVPIAEFTAANEAGGGRSWTRSASCAPTRPRTPPPSWTG